MSKAVMHDIIPVSKPRMTQRDKWAKRPAVLKYFAFKDECRLKKVMIPESKGHIVFGIPMPKSWSKKKKAEMLHQPHQQRPDLDNLCKGLFDAVLDEDCRVWDGRSTKVWADDGYIAIGECE